ncbi:MAG: type II toxin-antitoxin system HicB family antitoxin [Hyphomicrobiales bacterium]
MRKYTVVLSPDPERGGYSVSVPAMPGAASQGRTREEALANIREAMEGWLEVALEDDQDALEETPELVAAGVQRILGHRREFGWNLDIETATVDLVVAAAA